MNLETLELTPSWEWPESAVETLLAVLRHRSAAAADRLLAVELAGEITVAGDPIGEALLTILQSADEPAELRGDAALSMGPALEHADLAGFDDPDDILISQALFERINKVLHDLYQDQRLPTDLRRKVLEAAVRAPQDWQSAAVQQAFTSESEDWRLTAVFCMQFLSGFEEQILEALRSNAPDIFYQAVVAAGTWGLEEAWAYVVAILEAEESDKDLLMAAIAAVPAIKPDMAEEILDQFAEHEDEEISETAMEALAMLEMADEYEDDDDGDDEEDWD